MVGAEQEEEDELDSEDFSEQIAPMLVNIVYLIALACYMFCLKCAADCSTKVNKFWFSFYYTVFWNMPIRVFIEGYMPNAH